MNRHCPYCLQENPAPGSRPLLVKRAGFYRRTSDSRRIQRYRCGKCRRFFSSATVHPAYRQNKRHMNDRLRKLLCSGVSLRRSAKLLHLSRTTVSRKLLYLADRARENLQSHNLRHRPRALVVEFDDLETFEHTKCKPLSVTLAVESKSRRILGFEVSRMPAKGHLVAIARKKYGPRLDERSHGRRKLFAGIKPLVLPDGVFKSDENPHYPVDLKNFFPSAEHLAFKGRRGSIVGQGELKKIRFDPLFSINHTCAMLRANVNRLFRRTWCTTKVPERLADHLAIYAEYHNTSLIGPL